MPPTPPLEYETNRPHAANSTPRPELYYFAVWAAGVSAAVAILLFLAYVLTEISLILLFGFIWLFVGGFLTLFAWLSGLIYAGEAKDAGYLSPHTRRRARLARILPLANIPLAVLCVFAGLWAWTRASMRMTLRVINPSAVSAESVIAVFSDGSHRNLGRVPAKGSIEVRFVLPVTGAIYLDVSQGSKTWRQPATEALDADDLAGGGPYLVTLDPAMRR